TAESYARVLRRPHRRHARGRRSADVGRHRNRRRGRRARRARLRRCFARRALRARRHTNCHDSPARRARMSQLGAAIPFYRRLASPLHAARATVSAAWALALLTAALVCESPVVLGALLLSVLAASAAARVG